MSLESLDAGPASPPPSQPAGFWLRLAAFILDWLLLGGMSYVLWGNEVVHTSTTPLLLRLDYQNIQLLLPLGYHLIFWIWRGATPGKVLCGIQIQDADHGPLRPGQAILRLLAYGPSFFLFGLGFLWIAFDKDKQGWHDKIAGTRVIRRQRP